MESGDGVVSTVLAPNEMTADEEKGSDRGSGVQTGTTAVLTQRDSDSTILQRH